MVNVQKVVLAVDDSAENLNVITGLLNDIYKVRACRSGARALEIAKTSPPDLILLDITMPEMDGYEVLEALRADSATRDIPVIFLTALSEADDEAKGLALGAVDYIAKPFNPMIVKARVATHLELVYQRRQTEKLLENILPKKVIADLKEKGYAKPELFTHVSLFFSDMVNFTKISASLPPEFLIEELSTIFSAFDEIMQKNCCERIKTIGDAYVAVCGLPVEDSAHAIKMTRAALECLEYLKARNEISTIKWETRIGIHSGEVVAGIVGTKKYVYDVFGDTVNTASRVETASEPMRLSVSASTLELLQDQFETEPRGEIEMKGKGMLPLYFVNSLKASAREKKLES